MNQKLIFTKLSFTQEKSHLPCTYAVGAVYEDQKMVDVTLQPLKTETILNNIYIARVQNVVEHLNAAFVEIAPGQRCYLPLEDAKHPLFTKKQSKKSLAAKTLSIGDELVVQVVKEAIKTKEAIVSTNLSFLGEAVILTSANNKIGVSSKLDKKTAAHLKALAEELLQTYDADPIHSQAISQEDRSVSQCRCGIIMRTNAAHIARNNIYDEFHKLMSEYQELCTVAPTRKLYSCLRREQPFYLKMFQDADKTVLEEVLTDDIEIYRQLQETYHLPQSPDSRKTLPAHLPDSEKQSQTADMPDNTKQTPMADVPVAHKPCGCRLRFYEDNLLSLAQLYQIPSQIYAATKERVWLKSGANIIIQPTEALTVIDVNSSKNISKKEKQQYHYLINLEAAAEIALQLRLRNLSGIIIVDFIDLKDPKKKEDLMTAFRKFLKQDPVPVQLVDMTKLGLVELTRKKQRKSLAEQLDVPMNVSS